MQPFTNIITTCLSPLVIASCYPAALLQQHVKLIELCHQSAAFCKVQWTTAWPHTLLPFRELTYLATLFRNFCRKVIGEILDFVQQECAGPEGGVPVFVVHNGKNFDFKFLDQACKRCAFELPGQWQWLDSLILAKACVKDPDEPDRKVSVKQAGHVSCHADQCLN